MGAEWESCSLCRVRGSLCRSVESNDVCGCGSYALLTCYTWECDQVSTAGQIEVVKEMETS